MHLLGELHHVLCRIAKRRLRLRSRAIDEHLHAQSDSKVHGTSASFLPLPKGYSARIRQGAGKVWERVWQGLQASLISMDSFATYELMTLAIDASPLTAMASIAAYVVLAVSLVYASAVDVRTRLVPLSALLASLVAWLLAVAGGAIGGGCPFLFDFGSSRLFSWAIASVLGGVVTSGVATLCAVTLERRTGSLALGGGDVKLLFVVGLYLGPEGGIASLGIACVLALLWQVILFVIGAFARIARKRRGAPSRGISRSKTSSMSSSRFLSNRPFPFVPFIAIAALVVMLTGGIWYG